MSRYFRMRALRAVVALATAAGAAWSAAGIIAPPAFAIANGTSITTAPAWAAYITIVNKFLFFQSPQQRCTGTIVASDWILTAAHCVVQEKNGKLTTSQLPKSAFEVVLNRSNLTSHWQGGQWTVDGPGRISLAVMVCRPGRGGFPAAPPGPARHPAPPATRPRQPRRDRRAVTLSRL
jgi:Trypsin